MFDEIFLLVATATDTTDPSKKPTGGLFGSTWGIIIIYALIFGLMYLLLIRPQSKKKKQEEELRSKVEIGDEITTIGGIVGKVVSIKEDTDTIVLETGADRVKLRIKRWAIGTNDTQNERARSEKAAAASNKKGFLDKLNEKMEKKAKEKEEKNN